MKSLTSLMTFFSILSLASLDEAPAFTNDGSHEFAHVHDNKLLTDVERDEFLAIREADSWRNEQWHRAAGEHFADVVAWGRLSTWP